MIEYTREELERYAPNDEILPQLLKAERQGNEELATQLRRKMIYPPVAMLNLLDNMGADWIREQGLNTVEAERKFGMDWMEREIDDLERLL